MLWLVALAVPWPARGWIVITAIVIDFATPAFTLAAQRALPRLSRSHLPERFGLFILIVLGESVISVEQAVGNNYLRGSLAHITAGPAALAIAFVLWWLYFDHVAENPPLPGALLTLLWSYPHLVMAVALGTLGAGIQSYVGVTGASSQATLMLVCLSVGSAYAMIGFLEFMTEPSAERHHPARSLGVHGGSAIIACALGFAATAVNDLWIFATLVGLGVLQIAYGFATRARHLRWDAEEPAEG
jgi:low temperature requirement protein LtrA